MHVYIYAVYLAGRSLKAHLYTDQIRQFLAERFLNAQSSRSIYTVVFGRGIF